jgi:hypothetical protein
VINLLLNNIKVKVSLFNKRFIRMRIHDNCHMLIKKSNCEYISKFLLCLKIDNYLETCNTIT